MPYEDSKVPIEKSQRDIKSLLARFDVQATRFTSFPAYTMLEFVRGVETGSRVTYRITIQPKLDKVGASVTMWDRAERQVWRVVYWWLKAKIEAIEFGLVEFEQDFLPYMLLADSDGQSRSVAELLFERLAGRLVLPDDPFGGLQLALPNGRP